MDTSVIPNIQISKFKDKYGTVYLGSAAADLPCWIGYLLNENAKEVITNRQFDVGIQNSNNNNTSFSASKEQTNAYFYLIEHQEKIKQNILNTLKAIFPDWLSNEFSSYDRINFPKLSELTPEFDFKTYIGPSSINIENDVKDSVAYITWHFNCLWDTEHGFEVITHKERVLEIAPQADLLKINEDNGTYLETNNSLDDYLNIVTQKKKWWKFW